jgi:hypothetical protein
LVSKRFKIKSTSRDKSNRQGIKTLTVFFLFDIVFDTMANQMTPNPSILFESNRISNGANAHKVNNLLAAYYGFIECYNRIGDKYHDDVKRIELELRIFIQNEKSLFLKPEFCYV